MVATAPIPTNERARLDDLYSYHIIGTPPDDRFDMFTRLCTWIYQVPFSAINLIDADYTFFKSTVGIPVYRPRRATSICAHAVAGDAAIMEVEDLTTDDRFWDHPLAAKGMRFYAGAVLRSPEGHALGTLCIGDQRARRMAERERAILLELAHGVGAVMELHRSSRLLLHLANEDALTGLCNRRLSWSGCERCLRRRAMGQGGRCCVWTWTNSSRSTTRTGTLRVTHCCAKSAGA